MPFTLKCLFWSFWCSSRFCPEVHIGDTGHQIKTCHGFKRIIKNQVHQWINGSLNDILVPVESFHLRSMFQEVIKHEQRFDYDRVPAVLELCYQAGVEIPEEYLSNSRLESTKGDETIATPLSSEELHSMAQRTLDAWESLRLGVQKLLLVYPAKVCEHCSEVHVGPSGHKARLCGIFKYESWRAAHKWKRAEVDDLVPPKFVWHRRPHDPQVLLDSGRGYYGHAPAVVELCSKAGARVPKKYFCMMKVYGLTHSWVWCMILIHCIISWLTQSQCSCRMKAHNFILLSSFRYGEIAQCNQISLPASFAKDQLRMYAISSIIWFIVILFKFWLIDMYVCMYSFSHTWTKSLNSTNLDVCSGIGSKTGIRMNEQCCNINHHILGIYWKYFITDPINLLQN